MVVDNIDIETANTILRHVQFAATRGDPAGVVGLGYMHMRGLIPIMSSVPVSASSSITEGQKEVFIGKRNITRAIELFSRAQGKHPDAAWHLGMNHESLVN